jgi:hypothetical protein
MNRSWEEALRSLARRAQGPFRVLAYGVTATSEEAPIRKSELAALLREEGFDAESGVEVELDASGAGATTRPSFHVRVLAWIESTPPPASEPRPEQHGIPTEEARRRLRELTTDLDSYLGGGDAGPAPAEVGAASGDGPGPKAAPLLLVGRLEDLGSDAEGIGSAVEAILVRGAHLLIPPEALDTRTREGRGRTALAIRLGGIKAAIARERSLKELGRRRHGLEVYGPVPFGFERQGKRLVPVGAQMESVARIRELANRGAAPFEIAMALNGERRTWKDGTFWTGRRVDLVLRNPIHDRLLREDIA